MSYFTDGPITTTVNNSKFQPDTSFNGFAFDVRKGIFLNIPERDQKRFIRPRNPEHFETNYEDGRQ